MRRGGGSGSSSPVFHQKPRNHALAAGIACPTLRACKCRNEGGLSATTDSRTNLMAAARPHALRRRRQRRHSCRPAGRQPASVTVDNAVSATRQAAASTTIRRGSRIRTPPTSLTLVELIDGASGASRTPRDRPRPSHEWCRLAGSELPGSASPAGSPTVAGLPA